MEIPKLYSVSEAAEILGIKETTLATWRCRRSVEVPYLKIGHRVMYAEDDLARFIESRRRGG